jgi:hypothetical protein
MNDLWLSLNGQIPGIIEMMASLDMLILFMSLIALFISFSTFAKDYPTSVFLASFISFFILQIPSELLATIINATNQPSYIAFSVIYILLTFIIARFLFKNELFEPLSSPSSPKEKLVFSVVIIGLWAIILIQTFPIELQQLTSSSFQFLFFSKYSSEFWSILSPVSLLVFLKGND